MERSEEERKEFMRRAEETKHILNEIEILKEQVLQQADSTSSPAIIGHCLVWIHSMNLMLDRTQT